MVVSDANSYINVKEKWRLLNIDAVNVVAKFDLLIVEGLTIRLVSS